MSFFETPPKKKKHNYSDSVSTTGDAGDENKNVPPPSGLEDLLDRRQNNKWVKYKNYYRTKLDLQSFKENQIFCQVR